MIKNFLLFLLRNSLKTRYKIEIKDPNLLKYDGPSLIFPNHVALIDPVILVSFLSPYVSLSPLASKKYYNKKGIKQAMDLVDTIPIDDLEAGGDKDQIKEALENVVNGLKNNKHILLYPSGQIYRQGFEVIRGKQLAYQVANLMPENTKVFGIRTRGLWGSMYSMSWDNGKTGLAKLILLSIWFLIANLFFFLPKRKVEIEIIDITNQINTYKNMSLNDFNGFLENFYNEKGEEKVNYISHYFYYNDVKDKKEPEIITGSLKDLENIKRHNLDDIPVEIKKTIFEKISEIKQIPIDSIDENKNLVIDLYFDSLDMAEIKSFIQSKFSQSSNPPITDLKSVADLLVMAIGKSETEEKLKDCNWKKFKGKKYIYEKIS